MPEASPVTKAEIPGFKSIEKPKLMTVVILQKRETNGHERDKNQNLQGSPSLPGPTSFLLRVGFSSAAADLGVGEGGRCGAGSGGRG